MKRTSFWLDTPSRLPGLPEAHDLPDQADVAIIGGGFTGLSAARTLARAGASVVLFERETIGWGASSRNAGITGCGLKASASTIFKRYGEKCGRMFWQASLDALDLIKELVSEGVKCDFHQNGDLCVAYKPSHLEGFKQRITWHKQHLDHTLHMISASDLGAEIGSQAYFGGVLDEHGAGLNPLQLVLGLAQLALKHGAVLFERTPVTRISRVGKGFHVQTTRGDLQVRDMIAATNGYTDSLVPGLKSRVIPVGSYSIVTEPLPQEMQKQISPKGRMFWDSKWFLNYFRITPDGRLLWGGRNDLSTNLDLEKSTHILGEQMVRAFPQVRGIPITHTWSGHLGLTFDLMPHIGRVKGVHYAMGYGGHGIHTALYLGREVARLLTGEKNSSPFAEIPHRTYFFYQKRPWFMPVAVRYYRFKEWRS